MIVDPSALLSGIFAESDADHFTARLAGEPDCKISAKGYLEAAVRQDQLLGRVDPRLALSKSTGEALLFKGNDLSQTDIRPA